MKKSIIKKCTVVVAAALITGTVTAVGGIRANLRYIDNMTTAYAETNTDIEGVKVVSAGGWNEMLYLVVSGIDHSDITGVSYSGASNGRFSADDLEYLVRDTDNGLRVDILGLKAGNYTVTITTSKGDITESNISVGTQDRSGYAHFNYTEGVGAYNDNGELKADAIILYVTDEIKDTVSVTSKDGTTVSGIGNILNSAGQDVPRTVLLSLFVSSETSLHLMD